VKSTALKALRFTESFCAHIARHGSDIVNPRGCSNIWIACSNSTWCKGISSNCFLFSCDSRGFIIVWAPPSKESCRLKLVQWSLYVPPALTH
jgi:hypothetical protein